MLSLVGRGREELQSSQGIVRESFKVSSVVEDRIVFQTEYAFEDEALVSVSELRFMSYEAIARTLEEVGLSIQKLFGDWDGSSFDPKRSREMIFVVGKASRT